MSAIKVRVPARSQSYEIHVDSGLLRKLGDELRASVGHEARNAALITNKTVFELYGRRAIESLRRAGFVVKHWLMADGERHKSFRSLQHALEFLSEAGVQRNDVVVSLGGGVVGDLAGFAAAIYLRGISFVQVPTTLLAQIDASVGGKTGINIAAGKNLVGAFHQPQLVVIDVDTLRTLSRRELTSGLCEMVKQGAVAGPQLFAQTMQLLNRNEDNFNLREGNLDSPELVCATIGAHCRFKASIVSGDERENFSRTDGRSRRILNFGHTTAHALEKVTKYRRFRHGEAVGYGMLVAGEISKSLGMLPPDELELLCQAVTLCGPLPGAGDLSAAQIIEAMTVDKKAVRGKLKWVLLEKLGRPRIIDGQQIKPRVLRDALAAALNRS